ncbi:flagellar protein FlaG [Paralcaligenes ureilyticus]|uniref:Flagellar protein FlaG n=1 Tax=Paralcaligenes ureilyticus TaxID=627131 RepID=A0A4R3M636_9BURK|nr:flagellar protein FlaG [Paralcaligenes ureilyticus]TCT06967.1 flagellar protein FlaG [Paralcaligenes ureilyticus]
MALSTIATVPISPPADRAQLSPAFPDVKKAEPKPVEAKPAPATTSVEQVKQAVSKINTMVQGFDREVLFSVDHDSGKIVVKVMDTARNVVIRQIPSAEALAISHSLDKLQGLIINQKA